MTASEQGFQRYSRISGVVGISVGVLDLLGWSLDVEVFRSFLPELVAMNPMTAIAFIGIGLAMRLVGVEPVSECRRTLAVICAGTTTLIAVLKCLHFAGMDLEIDAFLFADRLAGYDPPNRMAPNTALNFLLQGAALLAIDFETRRGLRPAQILPLFSGCISLLAIVGYAYDVRTMYGISSFIPMALNTAIAFFALDLGILSARPGRGFMALVSSESAGGVLTRRLLPGAILVPLLVGAITREGYRAGLYGLGFGFALVVVSTVVILAALIWFAARTVHRLSAQRSEAMEALRRKTEELESVNRELEGFSYSVSHDLQAPLRHVAGYANLLMEDTQETVSPESRRYLQVITESTDRMKGMIADLLEFSRMGRVDLRKTRVRLEDLVRAVVQDHSGESGGRMIRWRVEAPDEVEADPAMLRLVFSNLIGNALKFTRNAEQALIEIGSHPEGSEVVCHVRDNGAGFDMSYSDRLFGVFQRLHKAEEFPGTGIGLAHVKRIIHRHGGRVWGEGKVGEGATFYFTLPRAEGPSTSSGRTEESARGVHDPAGPSTRREPVEPPVPLLRVRGDGVLLHLVVETLP